MEVDSCRRTARRRRIPATLNSQAAGRLFLVVAVSITAGGSGCASTSSHVGAFSTATRDLVDQALLAYEQVNASTVERKIAEIAADPSLLPDDSTFEGLLTNETLELRMRLLAELRAYSDALGELTLADFRKDVDRASTDLHGALRGLRDAYEAGGQTLTLTDDHLGIIAAAFDAIGASVAENKRRKAIKAVVIQADSAVQEVSRLLRVDLPQFSDFAMRNIETVETEMIKTYQRDAPRLTFSQRVARLEKIGEKNRLKKGIGRFFEDLGAGAAKIAGAHSALRAAVERDKFTTRELVEAIGELAAHAEAIRKFQRSLGESQTGQ